MSPRHQPDPDLDELIDDITVDCYDEAEQLTGFDVAFDNDATFPCPATVIGETVEILSVGLMGNRSELIATVRYHGRRYNLALLDIDLHANPTTARLLAAYRKWSGN